MVGLSCSVVVGVGVLFANGCGAMLKRNRNGMPNDDDDEEEEEEEDSILQFGVFTTEDLEEKEVLFVIPSSCIRRRCDRK